LIGQAEQLHGQMAAEMAVFAWTQGSGRYRLATS
jgi:hypothetical protein